MNDPLDGRPTPLIHVGYPKALSSWMQKHLFHPDQGYATVTNPLLAKLDIISTPPYGYDPHKTMAGLVERLPDDASLVPVITSEALVGNPATGGADGELNARRLADLVPNANVLLVIREQSAMIRSLYKTLVGFLGLPHSIDRLLQPRDQYATPQFSVDFLRYDQTVAMYRRIFGPERVIVVPHELFAVDPDGFLERIHTATGASPTKRPPTDSVVNAGSRLLDIQRERTRNMVFEGGPFNYLGLREPTPERTEARLKRINQTKSDNALNRRLEQRFARQVRAATAGTFTDGNARLSADLGLDLAAWGYQ